MCGDLMASDVDAKKVQGLRLPFCSRYHTPDTSGVNVLIQNITPPMFGYCFPPQVMVGAVMEHILEVVEHQSTTWWPKLEAMASASMVVWLDSHLAGCLAPMVMLNVPPLPQIGGPFIYNKYLLM
jgi:hypothetical protein